MVNAQEKKNIVLGFHVVVKNAEPRTLEAQKGSDFVPTEYMCSGGSVCAGSHFKGTWHHPVTQP